MSKLGFLIYILSAPAIAGTLMLIVMSMPPFKTSMLVGAALLGFVVALPVAWMVTKKLSASVKF
jgi:hypothetical protein